MNLKNKALVVLAALILGSASMAETVEMVIADKAYPVELDEHDASRALIARLPMTLEFEDFGATERIAYLNPKLDVGRAPTRTTPKAGDITYYVPWGNLAVFVRGFRPSESLVPLGRMSDEAMKALRDCGSTGVTIRRLSK